jgi:hypothetical protein
MRRSFGRKSCGEWHKKRGSGRRNRSVSGRGNDKRANAALATE